MFSREEYQAVTNRAGMTELSQRGRLRLTGADRRAYLHGLLTNDVVALGAGHGCYAALLTPQGRMVTDMRVLELGDAVLLDLPRPVSESVRDRLEQFIFAEDVQVENLTDRWSAFGTYGPSASSIVASAFARAGDASPLESLAPFGNVSWELNGSSVAVARNDDYGVPGFDLYAERTVGPELAAALRQAGAADLGGETLDVLRIEAGTPAFGVDMNEGTIPLEAGIQDRAISLTKGCYVGQEIIIRVLHRGQGRVARRLVGLTVQSGGPVPGRDDRIAREAREVGVVTSAAWSPALDRPVALGYLHRDFAEPGAVVSIAHGADTIEAVVATLPFIRRGAG